MALHGDISINNIPIATWVAQRIDELGAVDQESLYHCWYIKRDGFADEAVEADVTHRYSDGAAVLAQKALQLAEGGW